MTQKVENATLDPRLERRLRRSATGCWEWTGYRNRGGYGVFNGRGGRRFAHRAVYEQLVGPIAEGTELDHLCRNPGCVNPAHLEAVAHRVNLHRGETVNARNAAATHCPLGHPFSGSNLYRWRHERHCQQCRRAARRRFYDRTGR